MSRLRTAEEAVQDLQASLRVQWEKTAEVWLDANATEFERSHWQQIELAARRMLGALEQLREVEREVRSRLD
jgi:hypothetical protein